VKRSPPCVACTFQKAILERGRGQVPGPPCVPRILGSGRPLSRGSSGDASTGNAKRCSDVRPQRRWHSLWGTQVPAGALRQRRRRVAQLRGVLTAQWPEAWFTCALLNAEIPAQVADTLAEIQERHEAVKELEKSLLDLHQIFLVCKALNPDMSSEKESHRTSANSRHTSLAWRPIDVLAAVHPDSMLPS
jgi:Syntaxin